MVLKPSRGLEVKKAQPISKNCFFFKFSNIFKGV